MSESQTLTTFGVTYGAFTMGQGSVRTVLVDGRRVFDDGASTQVDEREVYQTISDSVRERAARLSFDPGPQWPVVRS